MPVAKAHKLVPALATATCLVALLTHASELRANALAHDLSGNSTAADLQVRSNQLVLDTFGTRVVRAVEKKSLAGYSGLTVNPKSRALAVYWHGQVPPPIHNIVQAAKAADVDASVNSAPYSLEQLRHARQVVADDAEAEGVGLVQIEIAPDGSGLAVGTSGQLSEVWELTSVKRSDVTVSVYKESPIVAATRWNDTSPYRGGAVIQSLENGYYCSTAFGVHYGTIPDQEMMLTAAHCISDLGEMWSNGIGAPVGPAYGTSQATDSAWINTSYFFGSTSSDRIYTGLTDPLGLGTGERFNTVSAFAFNFVGDLVRSSGAFSGERGNIEVTNTDVLYYITGADGSPRRVFGIEAEQIDEQNAFGEGDSGGPMFTYASGPVEGRGIISAGYTDSETACTGVRGDRRCFWRVLYTDLFTILDNNNLVLN